jgi:hypothetical protein
VKEQEQHRAQAIPESFSVITAREREEIEQTASSIIADAQAIVVKTAPEYRAAGEILKRIKAAQKKLADRKDALVRPINQGLKAIRELFRDPEISLELAEGLVKRQMLAFDDEQERLRREAQRKLDEKARAEQERKNAQAQKAAADAEAARASGDVGKAERLQERSHALADQAAAVVAPVVQRDSPRVPGVVPRETWSAVVTDLPALVKAIAEEKVPITAVLANMPFLNNQARALKRELRYPGVTAVVDKGIAAGSK